MRYGGHEGTFGGAGQVFANPTIIGASGSGYPMILAQSWEAVSAPADTNENILATITVPAGSMGANGMLRLVAFWAMTNSANAKTMRVRFGGVGGAAYEILPSVVNIDTARTNVWIANKNAANSQRGHGASQIPAFSQPTGAVAVVTSIDTTAATTLVLTAQKTLAGETATLEGYSVELIKPAS